MSEALFPIMAVSYRADEEIRSARKEGYTTLVIGIPWPMIQPHEKQAQINHSQSLKRLWERGGLGACEAVAILENRRHRKMSLGASHKRLAEMLAEFEGTGSADTTREGEIR